MPRFLCFALFALSTCWMTERSAIAGIIIDIGEITLQENLADQVVPIFVGGGDLVQGINFNLQVADGGPLEGGSILGPAITSVDLIGSGTIFFGKQYWPT